MNKVIEKPNMCNGSYKGCHKIAEAPGLHLCMQNPNHCRWIYNTGRHEVNLGDYPATPTVTAIKRASVTDMISASIGLNRGLSPESLTRNLMAFQRLIKSGHFTGSLSHHDTAHLMDLIYQMKPEREHMDTPIELEMIPIAMAELTKRDDIASKALEFSILTTGRFNDIARLKWINFDLNANQIILKFGPSIQHLVPLSDSGTILINGLPTSSNFVFSTNVGDPITVNELQRKAKKFDPKFSSYKIRTAFRTWVIREFGSNSQLGWSKTSGFGRKLKNGNHKYAIENLQTPEVMAAWSDFCYSRV